MTASHKSLTRGESCRSAVVAALKQAGPAGMNTVELGAAVGVTMKMAGYYAKMSGQCVRANTRSDCYKRWWHQDYAADAAAYAKHLSAHRTRCKWAPERLDQLEAVINAAGKDGVLMTAVVAQMGLARTTVGEMAVVLVKAKRIQRIKVTVDHHCAIRYLPAGAPLPPRQPSKKERDRKAQQARAKARREAAEAKLRAEVERMKRAALRAEPKLTAAQEWAAKPADMSKAKITICPSGEDRRFKVDKPERCFSALPPGWYVSDETWAARAYA